jgi:hypothetical protein
MFNFSKIYPLMMSIQQPKYDIYVQNYSGSVTPQLSHQGNLIAGRTFKRKKSQG